MEDAVRLSIVKKEESQILEKNSTFPMICHLTWNDIYSAYCPLFNGIINGNGKYKPIDRCCVWGLIVLMMATRGHRHHNFEQLQHNEN